MKLGTSRKNMAQDRRTYGGVALRAIRQSDGQIISRPSREGSGAKFVSLSPCPLCPFSCAPLRLCVRSPPASHRGRAAGLPDGLTRKSRLWALNRRIDAQTAGTCRASRFDTSAPR